MNEKALIQGQIYTFLELLPTLDQNEDMILCENTSGQKYICPVNLWKKTLYPPRNPP